MNINNQITTAHVLFQFWYIYGRKLTNQVFDYLTTIAKIQILEDKMLKADLKHMRMQIAVDDWDEFESVFNDYQKDLKPIVKRSKRKLYLNEMIELAIKLAGTFSKERKKEIRNSLENIHPYLLREASVTFDPDVVDPGEKWVYAFNRCCELLKIWVQEEIFPESIQK